MTTPTIIGFAGEAQAGKTTLANYVADQLDYALVAPFAGEIAAALTRAGIDKQKQPGLYRNLAQVIGTDIGRGFDPSFHGTPECIRRALWDCGLYAGDEYDCLARWIQNEVAPTRGPERWVEGWRRGWSVVTPLKYVLADDVRFENERAACDVVVFIERPKRPELVGKFRNHPSEAMAKAGPRETDWVVRNLADVGMLEVAGMLTVDTALRALAARALASATDTPSPKG